MLKLSANELRMKWISFFEKNDHYFLKTLSFIPKNDNSLLFVNSGIAAIKEYFVGNLSLPKNRVVNCQKVIRTNDIDEIGNTYRHHTFFEMLGNFSIANYFKKEAIYMAFEFLTQELKINKDKLFITVFEEDKESYELWMSLIKNKDQLIICGKDRNFWDMGTGPCGPCTEIYYDRGEKYDEKKQGIDLLINDLENERYLEIWNIVFSEFINKNGQYLKSNMKNIDTGAGLERLLTISEESSNNFENSLFFPIIQCIQRFSDVEYELGKKNKINSLFQIIADHMRSVVMLLDDGINFGNKGRDYVLRKLFRRSLVCGQILGVKEGFIPAVIDEIIKGLSDFHLGLKKHNEDIVKKIKEEYLLFGKILLKSQEHLNELIQNTQRTNIEEKIFILVERHGVPFDLIVEVLKTNEVFFSFEKYDILFSKHRIASKNCNFQNAFLQFENTREKNKDSEFIEDTFVLSKVKVVHIYNSSFEKVEALNGEEGFLVLNETVFFPNIGGQPCDKGKIEGIEVIDVAKNNIEQILHKVVGGNFKINTYVSIAIDEEYRLNICTQHTAEHLLYSTLQKVISPNIKRESGKKAFNSFSLKIYSPIEINKVNLQKVCNELSKIIVQNIQIKKWFATKEEAKALNLNVDKLIDSKKTENNFRIVQIGNESVELCIGTHLDNTKNLEDIKTMSLTKNGNNVYEIQVVAGFKNIENFYCEQKKDCIELFNKTIGKIVSWNNESKEKYKVDSAFEIEELNLFLNKFYGLFNSSLDKNWLEIKKSFNLLLQEIEEWKIKSEKELRKQIFLYLKNLIVLNDGEMFNCFILKNYNPKHILEFLKIYKLNNLEQNVMILNESTAKNQFYIIGNEDKSKDLLVYLKSEFKGIGGGSKLISGSLSFINQERDGFIEVIKKLFN